MIRKFKMTKKLLHKKQKMKVMKTCIKKKAKIMGKSRRKENEGLWKTKIMQKMNMMTKM